MSSPQTFSEVTEQLEMLRVEDPKFPGEPHFLVAHTRVQGSRYEGGEHARYYAKFALQVEYFFGPLHRQVGERVSSMGGESSWNDSVRLSNDEVMIRCEALRGLGLGGFLFNRVVRWAKHADPQSKVVPLSLSAVDGENEINRARRNRLYRKFGLRLVFQSADEVAGRSASDMKIEELIEWPDQTWPHIRTSNWNQGWHALASQYQKTRRELRQSRRLARVFRLKANRIEGHIRTFMAYLRMVVNWPLVIVAGILGFILGTQHVPDWVRSFWLWLVS
jgi:hypothetical protein